MKTTRLFKVEDVEEQRIRQLLWKREKGQSLLHDIWTNQTRTSTEVLVLPFVFPCRICSHHPPNLQLLVFSRLLAARLSHSIGKHHSSPSTARSLPKYTISIDDRARRRSSVTNCKTFSGFHRPNFLQFVQSNGLVCNTLCSGSRQSFCSSHNIPSLMLCRYRF
ncbi:hypothetical protein C8J56DRAFT_963176 [Mycena floridula]|nr:hypothetical protein C8J56DRAFT_963176 [Mycena floridula]